MRIKQQEDLTNIARADREKERAVAGEKIVAMGRLEGEVRKGEMEVES